VVEVRRSNCYENSVMSVRRDLLTPRKVGTIGRCESRVASAMLSNFCSARTVVLRRCVACDALPRVFRIRVVGHEGRVVVRVATSPP
jgi:hypothetical protein